MLTAAVLFPAVRGLKVTESAHVPPAAIEPGHVPTVKSAALTPINEIPLIVMATALGLVTVMFTGSDKDPVRVFEKFTVAGASVSDAGTVPLPVSAEVFGLLVAFEATDRKPFCIPPLEG